MMRLFHYILIKKENTVSKKDCFESTGLCINFTNHYVNELQLKKEERGRKETDRGKCIKEWNTVLNKDIHGKIKYERVNIESENFWKFRECKKDLQASLVLEKVASRIRCLVPSINSMCLQMVLIFTYLILMYLVLLLVYKSPIFSICSSFFKHSYSWILWIIWPSCAAIISTVAIIHFNPHITDTCTRARSQIHCGQESVD